MRIRMNTADTQSQVIQFLRLPLVVLVLFIHSNFNGVSESWSVLWTANETSVGPAMPTMGMVIDFISGSLGLLANPFFFFISGVLFFREGTFSKELYVQKLTNRIFSLLIPYILWNLIYLFMLSIVEGMKPGWTAIVDKPIEDFGFTDWLLAFWDTSRIGNQGGQTAPIAVQFWFIRDLIVLSILSPLVYRVISWLSAVRKEAVLVLFMALLYATRWFDGVPGISAQGLLFFSFGAYFGITRQKFTDVMRPLKWGGLFFAVFFFQMESPNLMYAGLIVFVISVVTRFIEERQRRNAATMIIPPFLSDASFFVFAYHTLPLGVILYLFKADIINPVNSLMGFVYFLLTPMLLLLLGAGIFHLLNRMFPKVMSILTGGR